MGNFAENLNLGNRFRPPWYNLIFKCFVLFNDHYNYGANPVKQGRIHVWSESAPAPPPFDR